MSFLKRFGWYLIGLSIGLVFLAIFLRKKSEETGVEFCYMPNCRVLKALRSKPLELHPQVGSIKDSSAIRYLLLEGEVQFDLSQPRAEPCGIYVITGSFEGRPLRLTLENCEDITRLTAYQEEK